MSLRANLTPYFCSIFFVATNSTYVSVSVRVYIFFHLCRMKTTNTAKKKNRSTETNLTRIYHVRNTCLLFYYIHMGKVERVTAL